MGTTSKENNRVEQKNEPIKEPQTSFNINININGISGNPSTNASLNQNYNSINNISVKDGDAAPAFFPNNPINSYSNDNNSNNNISINIQQNGNKITINNSINNKKEEKSSNNNIDPNIGGDNKINTNQENKEKSIEGNIDINKGGENKIFETKKDNIPKTTNKGNINIFMGGNQRIKETEENTKNVYDKPNQDYNIDNNNENNKRIYNNTGKSICDLSKEKNENNDKMENNDKKEKTTVSPSPDGNTNNKDNNAPNSNEIKNNKLYDVLSTSLVNLDKELFKEEIAKKRDEGYFPLFLKIDNNQLKFFFIKFDSTLRCLIKTYKMMMGIDDLKKEYTLYNDKNEILDQDIEIKYLDITPLSIISNHIKSNNK